MKEVILLLGSNIGDTEQHIFSAISNIENEVGKVVKKSEVLKTLPVEYDSMLIFSNIAIMIETNLSPIILLNQLKKIEQKMGRTEDSSVYGEYRDRIIDIDIVDYDRISFRSEKLSLPHEKHLYQRDFSQKLLAQLQ